MNMQVFEVKQSLLPFHMEGQVKDIQRQAHNSINLTQDNGAKYQNPQKNVKSVLDILLPTTIQESKVETARRILSLNCQSQTDEQIECVIADFEFLINSWLDDFERSMFEGKTLHQLFTS